MGFIILETVTISSTNKQRLMRVLGTAALLSHAVLAQQLPSLGGPGPVVNQLYAMEKISLNNEYTLLNKTTSADAFSKVQSVGSYQSSVSSVAVDALTDTVYIYAQASATQVSLTKLSSNGTQLWSSVFGSQTFAGDITAPQPLIDPQTGMVYVAGWTRGGFDGKTVIAPSEPRWQDWSYIAWADDVTYSPELMLAVAISGGRYNVLTSTDGRSWTQQTTPYSSWTSIVWSSQLGLFVVCGSTDTYRIATSPNGINWTGYNSSAVIGSYGWRSIALSPELRTFVVVAADNAVMTSHDAKTWVQRPHNVSGGWNCVVWAAELGRFVAVGTGGAVSMYSSDGINWLPGINVQDRNWQYVTWSGYLGMFAAVGGWGPAGNKLMTSTDGISWTLRATVNDVQDWNGIIWAPEIKLFMASALKYQQVMVSADGINWRAENMLANNGFQSPFWFPPAGVAGLVNGLGPLAVWYPRGEEVGFISQFSPADGTRLWTRFLPQHYGNVRITSLKQIGGDLLLGGHAQAPFALNQSDAFLLRVSKTSQYSQLYYSYWGTVTTDERLYAMEIDYSTNAVYSVGTTSAAVLYGRGSTGGVDIVIAKHQMDSGRRISVTLLGSSQNDWGTSIALDQKRNALYVGGSIADVQQPAPNQDQFVVKLSLSDMVVKWSRALAGCGGQDVINGMAVHPFSGNLITVGQLSACSASSPADAFDLSVIVFNHADGKRQQTLIAGSSQNDSVQSIDFRADGTFALTGQFDGSAAAISWNGPTAAVPNTFTLPLTATASVSLQFTGTVSQTIDRSQTIYPTATETSTLTVQQKASTQTQTIVSDRSVTETLVAVSSASVSVTQALAGQTIIQQAPVLTVLQHSQETVSVPTTVSINAVTTSIVIVAPITSGGNSGSSSNKSSDSDNQSNVLIWALVAGGAGVLLGMALLFGVMRMRKDRKQEAHRPSLTYRYPETFNSNDIYTPRSSKVPSKRHGGGFSGIQSPSFNQLKSDSQTIISQGSF